MTSLDPLPVWIAAALLATLFAHAGVAKLADRAAFEQHLAAYRVPDAALAALARPLPLLELLVAGLLLSPWRAAGAAMAGALLLLYAAAMGWHRAHGHAIDCGCGGAPLPLSWGLVVRNLGLAALAAVAGAGTLLRPLGLGDFLVVAGSVLLATLLHAALQQVLRHSAGARGRPLFGRI